MIHKGDITFNCFIKLHEIVFVSTHVIASSIVKIPHVLFGFYSFIVD